LAVAGSSRYRSYLYLEQIAILYVLATLSLVILLLIVAFADLEKVGRENADGFADKNL
jgi:hypothetical protein